MQRQAVGDLGEEPAAYLSRIVPLRGVEPDQPRDAVFLELRNHRELLGAFRTEPEIDADRPDRGSVADPEAGGDCRAGYRDTFERRIVHAGGVDEDLTDKGAPEGT